MELARKLGAVAIVLSTVSRVGGVLAVGCSFAHGGELTVELVGIKAIQEAEVPATESGVLRAVLVKEGDRVVAEETVLARIDARDAQLELERARIQRENARQQVENDVVIRLARELKKVADLDLKRAEESLERFPKSVTEAQMERLRIAVARAELEIERAERDIQSARLSLKSAMNQLDIARRRVDRHSIIAPIRGTIVQVTRRKGEWVELGQTVVRIVRNDQFRVEGFIGADQVAGNLVGRPAVLKVVVPGHGKSSFAGNVTFVSPEVNPVNGQVRLFAEVANRGDMLRPGLSASLVIRDVTDRGAERASVGGAIHGQ